MTEDQIRATLRTVFLDVFDNETFDFADDLSTETLKSWDSLGHIRLVMATEETFGISFTIDEIEGLTSVGRIIERVSANI